jgi:microcystin-dependent protein
MSEPFLSEIKIVSFNHAPKGWALCNGQFLPINQNQPLFALLGTTYGGNGQTTFALPNLQGRVPIHRGSGHTLGEAAGSTSVTVNIQQLPTHLHGLQASQTTGNAFLIPNNILAASNLSVYGPPALVAPEREEVIEAEDVQLSWEPQPALAYAPAESGGKTAALTTMDPSSVTSVGGSQPHNNMMPYLVLNFVIALQGIFPSPTRRPV